MTRQLNEMLIEKNANTGTVPVMFRSPSLTRRSIPYLRHNVGIRTRDVLHELQGYSYLDVCSSARVGTFLGRRIRAAMSPEQAQNVSQNSFSNLGGTASIPALEGLYQLVQYLLDTGTSNLSVTTFKLN